METYHKLIIQLESGLKTLEEQNLEILLKTEQAVKLCKQVLAQLQELVSQSNFNSNTEEIEFFKTIKPKVVSQLIYYIQYFNIHSKQPKGLNKNAVKYLNGHILEIQEYYKLNMEFYHYYLKNETTLDELYFLRSNKKVRLNIESYHFFTDQNFATSHDHTVATIMAYEKLIQHLHQDINKLKTNTMHTTTNTKAFQNYHKLNWTGNKTDLVELIYALHSSGVVNNGNVDIKDIALSLQEIFNIELGNYYHSFTEIRTRKINPTKFLDKLKENLQNYINGLDNIS